MRRISVRDERGVTILEVVVAAAILLAVTSAMLGTFTVAQRTTARNAARAESLGELRVVVQRLTKEARQAKLVRAGSSVSRLDIDTYINGAPRRVTYEATGTTLTRAVDGGAAIVVLERLTNTSIFRYAPSLEDATDIAMTVTVQPQTFDSDGARVSLSAEVEMRNRRGPA